MKKKEKFAAGLVLGIMLSFSFFNMPGLFPAYSPDSASAATCERTITGWVNTNGKDTEARFRYATDYSTVDNHGGSTTSIQNVPANQNQNIEARLTGLAPNTRYFYQLEIKWTTQSEWIGVDIENFVTDNCGGGEEPEPDQRPSCTAATPDYDVVQGNTTRRYAKGVQNATAVRFPAWSSDYGQDDIVWYEGRNAGGGTWYADIDISRHKPIGVKDYDINVHVYMYNNSFDEVWCDTADFKVPEPTEEDVCPNISGLQTRVPSGMHKDSRGDCVPDPEDVCPNISGIQTRVPAGRHIDSNGDCVRDDDDNPPTDVCPNISGLQTRVPSGMHKENGLCVDDYNPTDVCPNLTGLQTTVPSGMHKDSNGNCVDDYAPTDVCPNIAGNQSSVPSGMHKDSNGNCVPNDTDGDPPTVDITADDTRIDEGEDTRLRWTSTDADYCRAFGDWSGNKNTSGSERTDELDEDSTFEIRCYNDYGSDTDEVTVRVDEDDNNDDDEDICWNRNALNYGRSLPCRYYTPTQTPQLPTVLVYADQTNLPYRGSTTVRWSTVNANYCVASGGSTGWAGNKSIGPGSFYTGALTSARTYTLTCYNNAGSDTDSVAISVGSAPRTRIPTPPQVGTSLVVVTSSIDRNQPIVPTLDNTNPRPGDEITYTVTYQNIGTAAIRNLVLRLDLPYEVVYLYSTPPNPTMAGNTVIFSLGTLGANQSGTVTVRVRVRDDAPPGAFLNFPAVLSYVDPAGNPQTVTASVSAQVWREPEIIEEIPVRTEEGVSLAASIFGAGSGFWPTTLFGWLLLFILILLLVLLIRYLIAGAAAEPFARKTTTTTVEQHH